MKVSVIIVTHNSQPQIFRCVDSLIQNNDIGDELEIIIVDNESEDAQSLSAKLQKKYNNSIIFVSNCNRGYGHGNNVGFNYATAPIVMIMNPDVTMIQPVFMKVIKAFNADENVAMYGMKQMRSLTKPGLSFQLYESAPLILRLLANPLCNVLDLYYAQSMSLHGACFFVRSSVFSAIGRFDENIFMYGEEEDVHRRLRRQTNFRIMYNKHLRYLHNTEERSISIVAMNRRWRSFIYLCEKYSLSVDVYIRNELARLWLLYYSEIFRWRRRPGRRERLQFCRDNLVAMSRTHRQRDDEHSRSG